MILPWDVLKDEDSGDDPYRTCLYVCIGFSMVCFIVSSITGNVSQTDKLWSITPVVYAWICVVDKRTFFMAMLVSIWGIRLTYNFNRRGGYRFPRIWEGDEDYRWEILKSGQLPWFRILTNPFVWSIFNLIFISFYQHLLLLFIVSPSLFAHSAFKLAVSCDETNLNQLNGLDFLASFLVLLFVTLEGIADNQQFRFQSEKHRRLKNNEKLSGIYALGFCQTGLFRIVRKPNYASEQMVWISFYIFSVASFPNNYINWSISGCLLLVFLFQGSGWMTELVSKEKYPSYSEYQKRVPLYVPNILRTFGCGKERKLE